MNEGKTETNLLNAQVIILIYFKKKALTLWAWNIICNFVGNMSYK